MFLFVQLGCLALYWMVFPKQESICAFSICIVFLIILKKVLNLCLGWVSARIGLIELVLAGIISTFYMKSDSKVVYFYMYAVQSCGYIYKLMEPILFLNVSFKYSRKARESFSNNKYNSWAYAILFYAFAAIIISAYFYYEIAKSLFVSMQAGIVLIPCIFTVLLQILIIFST